ncbi:MAG: hypothetical protein K5871_08415 [Lachnospiraceae bacterium]|nr:hypothetical protein [Lachnospiraceae bacterium]
MRLKTERKLGPTDITYGIICAGKDLNIGLDMPVTVVFGGKRYSAKMHSKTKGRIDGLKQLYNDHHFSEGDVLELEYDDAENTVYIYTAEDTSQSIKENLNAEEVEVSCSCLGIPDPETWHDDPGVRSFPQSDCLWGCANSDYVVFQSEKRNFVIFDRATHSAKIISSTSLIYDSNDKSGRFYVEGGMAMTNAEFGNKVYFSDGETVFEWAMDSPDVHTISNYECPQYIKGMICWNDELYYILGDDGSECTWICNGLGEKRLLKENGEDILGVCEGQILIGDPGYDIYRVLYFATGKILKIEDYLKTIHPHSYFTERAGVCSDDVYAVNLAKRTIALKDREFVDGVKYREGDLVRIFYQDCMERDQYNRINEMELMDGCNCNAFRDIYGHKVTAHSRYGYDLAYQNPDGTSRSLFPTAGSCVPEGFQFVDSHTALIKTAEGEYAICDFMENKKYSIKA